MKFVVYGERRLGVLQGRRILDLDLAAQTNRCGDSDRIACTSLPALIEAGDRGLDLVRSLLDSFGESDQPGLHSDLLSTTLRAPFPGRRFVFAGMNVAEHVANAFTNRGRPTTAEEVREKTRRGRPAGFWVVAPPVGPGADIPIPKSANGLFDYEAELGVVLSRPGKNLSADEWADRIWGATLVIDWSIRSPALTQPLPFYGHKNFDCSTSIGPWIAVDEVDPFSWEIETRVNGQLRQHFTTADMIHSYGELLAQISVDLTLLPGDVLAGGTGPGTAVDSTVAPFDGPVPTDLFLEPGDTVEVTARHLGSLRAHMVVGA